MDTDNQSINQDPKGTPGAQQSSGQPQAPQQMPVYKEDPLQKTMRAGYTAMSLVGMVTYFWGIIKRFLPKK